MCLLKASFLSGKREDVSKHAVVHLGVRAVLFALTINMETIALDASTAAPTLPTGAIGQDVSRVVRRRRLYLV